MLKLLFQVIAGLILLLLRSDFAWLQWLEIFKPFVLGLFIDQAFQFMFIYLPVGVVDFASVEFNGSSKFKERSVVLSPAAIVKANPLAISIDAHQSILTIAHEVALFKVDKLAAAQFHDAIGAVADNASSHGDAA